MRRGRGLAVLGALMLVVGCTDDGESSPPVTDLPSLGVPETADAGSSGATTVPGSGDTTVASAPDTTGAPGSTSATDPTAPLTKEPARSFAGPGPYLVGVTTLDVGDRKAEVWYPVDPGDVEGAVSEEFDSLSVFPETIRALVPAELSGVIDTGAFRDVPVSLDAPFPVVVYSHGFGGYRQVATHYTTHMASWGFVVVSTDHLERGIAAQATGTLRQVPGQDVTDVRRSLAALAGSPLGAAADLEHVGIAGHSAGAGTAVRAAREMPVIDSFVSVAGGPAVVVRGGDTVGVAAAQITGSAMEHRVRIVSVGGGQATFRVDGGPPQTVDAGAPGDSITLDAEDGTVVLLREGTGRLRPGAVWVTQVAAPKPALVVLADGDIVVEPSRSERLYDMLAPPRYLVEVAGAGHNSVTDSCALIREQGGLQTLVPVIGADQVARGENGCTDAYVDPALVQAALGHWSVAFFRSTLRVIDDTATLTAGLPPDIVGLSLADQKSEP